MFFGEHYCISIFNEDSSKVLGRMDIEGVSEIEAYAITKSMLEFYRQNCWVIFTTFKDGEESKTRRTFIECGDIGKYLKKGDNNGEINKKS